MEPITAAVIPLHPAKVWDDISSQFLTSYWSLTMYILHVPEQLYEKLKEAPSKLHRVAQEGWMVPLEGGKVGDFNYSEHCLQCF